MRRLLILTTFTIILLLTLSITIVYSNELTGFKSIIVRKMKWLRIIDNGDSIRDVYGEFRGYNKSMVIILADDYKLLNMSMDILHYILGRHSPPVIVIASNIKTPYSIIEKYYDVEIYAYSPILSDLRYGLLIPVNTLSFETVFPNTIGFKGIYGNNIIRSNVLGNAFLYNGEDIENIPVFIEVEIGISNRTITLFLIGSPYVFVTSDPYLDYNLHYNSLRDYIVSKARGLGVQGAVIVNALSTNITLTLQPLEEETQAPGLGSWEGIQDLWPELNIPFVKLKFIPPPIRPWNIIIVVPYPIILIYLLVLLIIVLQLYTVFYSEIYVHRKPPPPYNLREVYESGKSHRIPRIYIPRDPMDYIMVLIRGYEEPDILIIESYSFLDKLFREKMRYGIDRIVRDKRALSIASGITGIKEEDLMDMLGLLYRTYVEIVSEEYASPKKYESILNNVLSIVCTLAKRLKEV